MLNIRFYNLTPLLLILVILFMMTWACQNPFATREPEEPITKRSAWIQPTSPTLALANLTNALKEKNISNYMRSLADSTNSPKTFRFIAEPTVALQNPGLFLQWQKEEELNFINQMMLYLPKDSAATLELKSLRETPSADSVVLVKEYRMTLGLNCENECPKELAGQAEFRLIRTDEDLWFIYLWSDFSTGDQATWSELRAYFGK